MVLAKIGSAASVGAVFDDADAVDVEAADDRPARRGAKLRAGDAGLREQEIAKLGGALAADFLVRHHGDGRKLIGDDGQHALLRRGSCPGPVVAAARSRRPGAVRATRTGLCEGTTVLRRTIGLGAVTVISGSCVEESGDAASWAIAWLLTAHSNSQLAPPKWNVRFFLNVIVRILIPSICNGSILIFLGGSATRGASDPLGECINQSRSGGGGRAGLEWKMERAEMREFGVDGQVEKLDRLR